MTDKLKTVGRSELKRQVRQLKREVEQLLERLDATNKELKLHMLWCGAGHKKPGRIQAAMDSLWVKLTKALNP